MKPDTRQFPTVNLNACGVPVHPGSWPPDLPTAPSEMVTHSGSSQA